jgi:uncharacterized damage-inducible protein DinB
MLLTEIRNLLRHMEWADALMWRAITGANRPAGDRPFTERLYHLHAVHWAYLQIWRGETVNIPKPETFADLPSLRTWARAYYAELPAFSNGLDEAALGRVITLPWADEIVRRFGSAHPATLGQTMLQVALHTTHHRGQLATKVRELGTDPPLMDFVAWIWMGQPAPVWEPS